MVLLKTRNYLDIKEFSPPYGDGTFEGSDGTKTVTFSPPYGDGTAFDEKFTVHSEFSPPYGDGTAQNPELS